jgi:hypothetical protein
MMRLLQVVCFCVICLLVFASYQQQVKVKEYQKQIGVLRHDMLVIGYANDVLQAEWAYVNGAERLQALLATPEGQTLGLEPRRPEHYIDLSEIPLKAPRNFHVKNLDDFPLLSLVALPYVRWLRYNESIPFADTSEPFLGDWIAFQNGQEYRLQ